MANDLSKVILGTGVSFHQWKSSLQAKLARRNVLGHVFHDIPGIRPLPAPAAITPPGSDADVTAKPTDEEIVAPEQWILGEIEAKNIITLRLSPSICPQNYDNMTAKQLYDNRASTRQQTAAAHYATALESLMSVSFHSTADEFIDQFLVSYQSVNNAADAFSTPSARLSEYHIGAGHAAALFVAGTKRIGWLNTWRDTRVFDSSNKYLPLEALMSSLRSISGNRSVQPNVASASSISHEDKLDPRLSVKNANTDTVINIVLDCIRNLRRVVTKETGHNRSKTAKEHQY